ncbi:MAG: stress response translation initiation inhibitor YciH, partial [Planctomycetes bacterium]|nr:stress response translation initiation inhibitor YciH [Planctomycetota bacterium]
SACACAARAAQAAAARAAQAAADGAGRTVKLRRDTAQRGGKVVTLIEGLALPGPALDQLLGELKRKCGSGGTRRDAVLELQGDQREKLALELARRGYVVRQAGG